MPLPQEHQQLDRGPVRGQGRDRDCAVGVCGGKGSSDLGKVAVVATTTTTGKMMTTVTLRKMVIMETIEEEVGGTVSTATATPEVQTRVLAEEEKGQS